MASPIWKPFSRFAALVVLLPALLAIGADVSPMDQEVLLRIQQQLRSDIRLRDASLNIQVMAGQVTLQGELPSFFERSRLERICRRIAGVDKVINRISVAPVAETDQDLKRAVERRLAMDPASRSSDVRVETDGTIVKLTGTVPSLYGRRRAQWVAEQVRGVSRVRNELTLGQPDEPAVVVADETIAASIREALSKDERSLARPVQVSVQEGVVTLEGEVSSHSRRRFYRHFVERIAGVRQVENLLEISLAGVRSATERPSLNDAALDVQLALNAAQIVPSELHARLSEEKIAIAGTVASLAQKQGIIRLARTFASGFPVVDAMDVAVDDRVPQVVNSELEQLLNTDVLLANASIDVTVEQGIATLSGTVDRFADKLRAERLATTVRGVRMIDNRLGVDWVATISDDGLKQSLERRLRSDRATAAALDSIHVSVEQGRVTLAGRVPDWDIRRKIAAVASGTDGIRSVENRLVVDGPN